MGKFACVFALLLPVCAAAFASGKLTDTDWKAINSNREAAIIRGIDRAAMEREQRLKDYSVTEHYTILNSHFPAPADVVVFVTYAENSGKSYQVKSRTGPSLLQSTVLDRILKEQAEMSRGVERQKILISSANYRMRFIGIEELNGRLCDVMEITPLQKSPHLLKGKVWVDAQNQHMVRIEGKPSASPSFWAGSPEVVRDYMDIGDFSFAWRSVAVSSTFLLGKTEMKIEYTGYKIGADPAR